MGFFWRGGGVQRDPLGCSFGGSSKGSARVFLRGVSQGPFTKVNPHGDPIVGSFSRVLINVDKLLYLVRCSLLH